MARIRTIKPIHWNDKELPKISLPAHLLWIASWNFSDDDGVFESDPLLIKSQVFPRRTDIRMEQISQWLDQLVKARFIIPFCYEGEGYYWSRTFKTHQKIDKRQPSKIPSEYLRKVHADWSAKIPDWSAGVGASIVEESIVRDSNGSPPTNLGEYSAKRIEELKADCLKDRIYFVEHVCRQNRIDESALVRFIDDFNDYLNSTTETVKFVKDYRKHFQNWLKKQDLRKYDPPKQGSNVLKDLGL
jgi:hypothetical protein